VYNNDILKIFDQAKEAVKKEEARVQIDETVQKKDLVAGAVGTALSITIPALRDSSPDQASCLPFREVKLNPVDAFYVCWMDACYICGSSGAADTMLFCVDCGEAFHSFCANAPIHSMDAAAVAGWRCPNCKICEISGDVPQDETRMLFCEMCDRAFSLDLIDPPLKSAPPGLWICGQCVECTTCGNMDPGGGASLKHWSRCPDKCYRCGGCQGLGEEYTKSMKCSICSKFLRTDERDVVECSDCNAKVHAGCDVRAREHLNRLESASRSQKAKKIQVSQKGKRSCPVCCEISHWIFPF